MVNLDSFLKLHDNKLSKYFTILKKRKTTNIACHCIETIFYIGILFACINNIKSFVTQTFRRIGEFMSINLKQIVALGILVSSTSVFASTHTANFSSVADTNANANSFSYSVDGINVNVSGWSDTFNNNSNSDTEIRTAALDKFGSSGWGVDNSDECSGSGGCSPQHSMDNIGSGGWVDYDMILVSFSEAVTLTGANFGWLYNTNSTEISVSAISGALASNLNGNTWQSVVNDAGNLWSDSSHVSNYYAGISAGQTASQYWLVGAYNSIFNTSFNGGSSNNDGMKLSSIDFKVTTDIPEPQTVFSLAIGLCILVLRKRKQLS